MAELKNSEGPPAAHNGDFLRKHNSSRPGAWKCLREARWRRPMWRLADSQHGSDQVVQRPGQVLPGDQDNLVIDVKMADRPSRNRAAGRQGGRAARARASSSSHGPVSLDAAVSAIRRRMVPSGPIRVTTTLISSVCPLRAHFGRQTTTMAACGHARLVTRLADWRKRDRAPQPSNDRRGSRQSRRGRPAQDPAASRTARRRRTAKRKITPNRKPGRWRVHHERAGWNDQFWCPCGSGGRHAAGAGDGSRRGKRGQCRAGSLGIGPVRIPNGMPTPDTVGLCRYRAYCDQLRAFGLSRYVALRRLGNGLACGCHGTAHGAWWPCHARGCSVPRG